MTVTLLIGQREIEIDNSLLQISQAVKGLLSDLQVTDVEFRVPAQYLSIIDICVNKICYDRKGQAVYHDELPVISDVKPLCLCFFIETFFADSVFFGYLIRQAYTIWDELYPCIPSLPDERSVYLYTPYEFVPKDYMSRESFFSEWLTINANKLVSLSGSRTYHTDVH